MCNIVLQFLYIFHEKIFFEIFLIPRGGEEHSEACRPTEEIYLPLYLERYIIQIQTEIHRYICADLCSQYSCSRHFEKISRIPKDSTHHFRFIMCVLIQILLGGGIYKTLLQGIFLSDFCIITCNQNTEWLFGLAYFLRILYLWFPQDSNFCSLDETEGLHRVRLFGWLIDVWVILLIIQ